MTTALERIGSVWLRHFRVYFRHIFSNALPPFLEPVLFFLGVGIGLGAYITKMDGMSYLLFLATGLIVTSPMYTASFECTFGTYIRLEFDRIYDGMLTAPISVEDIFLGEILWASTKGFFFALAALLIAMAAGIVREPMALLTPFVGFLTGFLFAALSLWVTTLVKTIQHFNFYFSGILSPMFFFSGVVFPLSQLPHFLRPLAEILPLTHAVRLSRDLCSGKISWMLAVDTAAMIGFGLLFTVWSIHRLKKKLIH